MPSFKFSEHPLAVIGLDVETDASNGNPMLFGFYYPDSKTYKAIYKPTVQSFFEIVRNICDHKKGHNFVTWGNLDIQIILRLFNPDAAERDRISKGLSGRVVNGEFKANPPILRYVTVRNRPEQIPFYVNHYIAGRSLKLAYLEAGHEFSIWVFNASQFFPKRIADSARGYGLHWTDFPLNTHIVDWKLYSQSDSYRSDVNASNRQDAVTVASLVGKLQDVFNQTFDCYPTLLVSTGSLTDAAVSKMLSSSKEEYQSNSGKWLRENVWRKHASEETCALLDVLASESYSAGYVDQYGVGYYNEAYNADISSAYPHKIRMLPDLRYSIIRSGCGDVVGAYRTAVAEGLDVEEMFIRGAVNIPQTLRYHPITIKKEQRTNYRPIGTFMASYTWHERDYCVSRGASFIDGDWVLLGLTKRVPAPIASVSERFGIMRDNLRKLLKKEHDDSRKILLDNQQLLVKLVDNSIYGKTVMTTEVVEDINGNPTIMGYVAGDRFNMVFGAIITSRTRIQISEACMAVAANGGLPIMVMTDAVYWYGNPNALPESLTRTEKTAGFFEPTTTVQNLYVIKTGQYEYSDTQGRYHYKLRGLPIQREIIDDATFADGSLSGSESFLRTIIKETCAGLPKFTHPKDIGIVLPTRRLKSIGSHDMSILGAIVAGETTIKPFVLSSKQQESYLDRWYDALDGHVWLLPTIAGSNGDTASEETPLAFFSAEYMAGVSDELAERRRATRESVRRSREPRKLAVHRRDSKKGRDEKTLFVWEMYTSHHGLPPNNYLHKPWRQLDEWYGVDSLQFRMSLTEEESDVPDN